MFIVVYRRAGYELTASFTDANAANVFASNFINYLCGDIAEINGPNGYHKIYSKFKKSA